MIKKEAAQGILMVIDLFHNCGEGFRNLYVC